MVINSTCGVGYRRQEGEYQYPTVPLQSQHKLGLRRTRTNYGFKGLKSLTASGSHAGDAHGVGRAAVVVYGPLL